MLQAALLPQSEILRSVLHKISIYWHSLTNFTDIHRCWTRFGVHSLVRSLLFQQVHILLESVLSLLFVKVSQLSGRQVPTQVEESGLLNSDLQIARELLARQARFTMKMLSSLIMLEDKKQ